MPGKLRIISGKWRSRRLDVIEAADLRPTPDRVRETLFNWLQPYIEGAHCLDLYAGSGSLGFESLSRGAEAVTLVDHSEQVIRNLSMQAARLEASGLEIICADASVWLQSCSRQYDIIFLDPPYSKNQLGHIIGQLLNCDCLHPGSLLYAESDQDFSHDNDCLLLLKASKAGTIYFKLYEYVERSTL